MIQKLKNHPTTCKEIKYSVKPTVLGQQNMDSNVTENF